MSFPSPPLHVVITGASKGIGKATALAFAEAGSVLYLCARNADQLQSAAADITRTCPGSVVHILACDVAVKSEAIAFGEWVNMRSPGVDVLVNNAGSFLPGSVFNEPDGTLESMLAVNLESAYHVTRAILPRMMEARRGHIFNLCSVASLKAYANGGSYSISKWALLGFSRNLREELKTYHIKVSAVMPGAVHTESWGDFDNSDDRIMIAADVANMIVAASRLSPGAVMEDLVLCPQLGDL